MHVVFPLRCFQKDLQWESQGAIDCLYKRILQYMHRVIQKVSNLGWIGFQNSI